MDVTTVPQSGSLLEHGPVNDYLIPSPIPICVHFSTISTFRSSEAHLNSDILREGLFGAVSSFSCCTLLLGNRAGQEKAQGKPFASDTSISILPGLPTHCIALAYNGLQTASTLQSTSTKAGLSKPYKGK